MKCDDIIISIVHPSIVWVEHWEATAAVSRSWQSASPSQGHQSGRIWKSWGIHILRVCIRLSDILVPTCRYWGKCLMQSVGGSASSVFHSNWWIVKFSLLIELKPCIYKNFHFDVQVAEHSLAAKIGLKQNDFLNSIAAKNVFELTHDQVTVKTWQYINPIEKQTNNSLSMELLNSSCFLFDCLRLFRRRSWSCLLATGSTWSLSGK